MSHEDFLNMMLNRTCPADKNEADNTCTYILDLHCQEVTVVARLVENGTFKDGVWVDGKWEVLSATFRHV